MSALKARIAELEGCLGVTIVSPTPHSSSEDANCVFRIAAFARAVTKFSIPRLTLDVSGVAAVAPVDRHTPRHPACCRAGS